MPHRRSLIVLALALSLTALGCSGDSDDDNGGEVSDRGTSAASDNGGGTQTDLVDARLGEAVCDLLTQDEVAEFAPDADTVGVYDNFLEPTGSVCVYEGAFNLQVNYPVVGGAPNTLETYRQDAAEGVAATPFESNGFAGLVEILEADSDLGTDATILDVLLQAGERILILDPDGLIPAESPEAETLKRLAVVAASRAS